VSAALVDWRLAERVAAAVAADARPARLDGEMAVAACAWAEPRVRAYTGLDAWRAPGPELIGRPAWSRNALATMRELSEPLEGRVAAGIGLPGPLGALAHSAAGSAAAVEVGVAAGYAARRVLGQYDVALARPRPARLLLVTPNLEAAARDLGAPLEPFLRWIALHELTHAAQFQAVAWLRDHVAGLVRELVEGVARELSSAGLGTLARGIATTDPRRALRALLQGQLPALLLSGEQRAALDRLQAAMALLEGHAEHVMDAAAPGDAGLRGRLDARRAARSGLGEIVGRLLGLEMKLRQYRLGKAFCDRVVEERGIEALNAAWSEPAALPRLDELEAPERWLERTAERAAA